MDTPLTIGQSLWLEHITRQHLQNESLVQYIREGSVTGASIVPFACSRSLRHTEAYDRAIRKKLASGLYGRALAMELILEDTRHAADLLRPVYDRTDGVDGWVALAIFPPAARDTASIVAAAKTVAAKLRRPNILLTLPGIPEWLEAIEEVIYSGVPVNFAFLLSREHFLDGARTWLRAIERRVAVGLNPAVPSFASISIGRLADALTAGETREELLPGATAMGRRIYKASRALHNSPEWERAYNAGARPLRLVWRMATDNDDGPQWDLLLPDLLIPLTVAALPETALKTILGNYRSRGEVSPADGDDCEQVFTLFARRGIDLAALAAGLQETEMSALTDSWIELLEAVACKSASLAGRYR